MTAKSISSKLTIVIGGNSYSLDSTKVSYVDLVPDTSNPRYAYLTKDGPE